MTLDKTWKECLRMWKWIVKQIDKGTDESIGTLKVQWLDEHGYGNNNIQAGCFFCHYITEKSEDCSICPGYLVDKKFSCQNKTYDYEYKPKKFYKKLLELDTKRRRKKGNEPSDFDTNKQ